MRLALSRRAHDDFTGGNARIKLGALDDGYCVLARGRDHDTLVAADPVFHPPTASSRLPVPTLRGSRSSPPTTLCTA